MADNDLHLQNYQDDLDTDPNKTDPIIPEQTDEPQDWTGVPNKELKEDLDRLAFDETQRGDDDLREHVEDMDEHDKNDR